MANVQEIPDADVWPTIFQHQHDLAVKYGPIETKNGFFHPNLTQGPIELDDANNQNWIKNLFWRTVEELAESFECFDQVDFDDWRSKWDTSTPTRHFFEELADATHFFVEVSGAVGFDATRVTEIWSALSGHTWRKPPGLNCEMAELRFVNAVGLVANTLKNKPWKTTQMPTDKSRFYENLDHAWVKFILLWRTTGATPQDVYSLYMKKNSVNKFRISSNY